MKSLKELEALQISYQQSLELAAKVVQASPNESAGLVAKRLFEMAQAIREEDMRRRPYVYSGESDF
ncbi:MAG: hypothetical protein Q4A60_06625 [Pasteurellaceae bacterium]|nr:hypothetical protein [Pasteurellaceae bacterium]